MSTAFNQTEFDLAYPDGVESTYWSVARNRILFSAIKSAGLRQVRWIEVGCGRGQVIKYMRSRGVDAWGVELADVQPLDGVDTFVSTNADAADLPDKDRYEGLMLLDVIEHIEDPVAFVKFLKQTFPNVRHILVTVPACEDLWSNYDEFYGHFRRYSLKSLEAEVAAMGMLPKQLSYFFHALYPAGRVVLALIGNRDIRITAPRGWWRMVHRLIGVAFHIENFLIPRRWPGTSLLCLARLGDIQQ